MNVKFGPALYGALILTAACAPALAAPATVVLDTSLLERPRVDAAELAGLQVGTTVELQRCEQQAWCLIEIGGRKGWVFMAALAFDAITTAGPSANPSGSTGGSGPMAGPAPALVGDLQGILYSISTSGDRLATYEAEKTKAEDPSRK